MQVVLTPELIATYRELMTNPKGNGLDFPALSEVFEKTEEATAKHVLHQQYIDLIQKPLPKLFFYIIMDELYPQAKAESGHLGYCVRIASSN
jgi:hypothetical protein